MTPTTRSAIKKYGADLCLKAYRIHTFRGEGASTISLQYNLGRDLTVRQVDAAINAGREISKDQE